MKHKMSVIIVGTMLAVTRASLPASATVSNTNGQHLMGRQHEVRLSETMHTTIFDNHKDKVIKISQVCFSKPKQCVQSPPPPPPPIS